MRCKNILFCIWTILHYINTHKFFTFTIINFSNNILRICDLFLSFLNNRKHGTNALIETKYLTNTKVPLKLH